MVLSRSTQVIKESREMSMSFDGTYARLNISSCKSEYSGSYKIVISNEFGKDESSAELKVAGKLIDRFLYSIPYYILYRPIYIYV